MRYAPLLVLAMLASCAEGPLSGAEVRAGTSVLVFFGSSPYPASRTVEIHAQAPDGTFEAIATATVSDDERWSVALSVPERYWWRPPCGAARFRFQTQDGDTIWGLDAACLEALGPSPGPLDRATCAVQDVDVLRAQTHHGDLVIEGPVPDKSYACIGEVDGDLSILAGAGTSWQNVFQEGVQFSLPNLESVRGSLSIDGGRTESVALPRLYSVGRDVSIHSWHFLAADLSAGGPPVGVRQGVNHVALPALSTVAGTLSVTAAEAPGGTLGPGPVRHVYDVPTLDEAFRVEVHVASASAAPSGLARLRRTFGLVFDWGTGDLDANDLLGSLEYLGGDATFSLPANALRALPALSYVHDLVLAPAGPAAVTVYPEFLPALSFVQGDLVASEVSSPPFCAVGVVLPGLESVFSTLRITGGTLHAPIGSTSGRPLRLGGLEISGTGAEFVPLHGEVELSDGAPVSFTDNPALCDCQIAAFADRLAAGGWSGTITSTGNGAAAVCAPCPDATCIP